jgi:hypothetical protein
MFTTVHLRPALLAALTVSIAAGCTHSRGAGAKPAAAPVAQEALRTSIESVDRGASSVTVRDADGRPLTLVASDPALVTPLHPRDPVRLIYQQTLSLELEDEQPVGNAESVREASHLAPVAALDPHTPAFWHRVNTVVEILAVAPAGSAATFRSPEGNVRRVEVGDLRERERVAKLRPGDEVAVAFTDKLVLERD